MENQTIRFIILLVSLMLFPFLLFFSKKVKYEVESLTDIKQEIIEYFKTIKIDDIYG